MATTTRSKKKHKYKKTDQRSAEERVADQIIEMLDRGDLPPWQRPWRLSRGGDPRNAVSNREYRGINHWLTGLAQEAKGYEDPRWLSFKQATDRGGHVRKGEKATQIIFWKLITRQGDADEETSEPKVNRYPVSCIYNIFNVEQTEDCDIAMLEPEPEGGDPIEAAELIIAGMPNPPAMETYKIGNQSPHYIPARDIVRVPDIARYADSELYYNSFFHELTHATGHPDRLNRFQPDVRNDLHGYGVEELVAGMGAAMLASRAGLTVATLETDASYLAEWSRTIKADKGMIVTAAQRAQKAHDYIMGRAAHEDAEETETSHA